MSTRLNNARYFLLAGIYDAVLQWFYRPLVRQLVDAVNAEPGAHVLEVGVGTGISIPYYAAHKQVMAIDCSAPMLRRAGQKAVLHPLVRVALRQACAEDLSAEVAGFEQVVFCNSLAVVSPPAELLRTYYQVLRPGGSLYLLNHFTPEHGPLRQLDRLLTPVGRLLGFQSFFPLLPLLAPGAQVRQTPLRAGYWRLVRIHKPISSPVLC